VLHRRHPASLIIASFRLFSESDKLLAAGAAFDASACIGIPIAPARTSGIGYGAEYGVSRQRPPDPLQCELTHRLDLHGVLDLREHPRTNQTLYEPPATVGAQQELNYFASMQRRCPASLAAINISRLAALPVGNMIRATATRSSKSSLLGSDSGKTSHR
jgi:hypothetical protein